MLVDPLLVQHHQHLIRNVHTPMNPNHRFYFLGDDDLLEILGQARSPAVIQAHLRKLFAGIHRVRRGGGGVFNCKTCPRPTP